MPESLAKETAQVARLRAGDYRVVSTAQEVARSDGGEVSQDMRRGVERVTGYEVTEGQVLALEWRRVMDMGAAWVGALGLGGREHMVRVRSGGRVVTRIMLAGRYDLQQGKAEGYVEDGRVVYVYSGTASQGGVMKTKQEVYIDEANLLVVSRDFELPYRIEGEEVILSRKEIVKARRVWDWDWELPYCVQARRAWDWDWELPYCVQARRVLA